MAGAGARLVVAMGVRTVLALGGRATGVGIGPVGLGAVVRAGGVGAPGVGAVAAHGRGVGPGGRAVGIPAAILQAVGGVSRRGAGAVPPQHVRGIPVHRVRGGSARAVAVHAVHVPAGAVGCERVARAAAVAAGQHGVAVRPRVRRTRVRRVARRPGGVGARGVAALQPLLDAAVARAGSRGAGRICAIFADGLRIGRGLVRFVLGEGGCGAEQHGAREEAAGFYDSHKSLPLLDSVIHRHHGTEPRRRTVHPPLGGNFLVLAYQGFPRVLARGSLGPPFLIQRFGDTSVIAVP